MKLNRRSILLAALRLPYPEGEGGGGSPPAPPAPAPPPPPNSGPLSALAKEGEESDADLEKWKPKNATDYDLRTLPKDMRDEDPQKVIANLAKANKGFRDAQARQERAPEKADDYTLELDPKIKDHFPELDSDPAYKALRNNLHKAGLPQSKFADVAKGVLQELVDSGVISKPVTLEGESEKLGGKDKAKQRTLDAKSQVESIIANKVLDAGGKHPGRTERLAGALQSLWTHAEGVELLEILREGRQEQGPGSGGGGSGGATTMAEVKERMKDPRYSSTSPAYDVNFRRDTVRMLKQLTGEN